ncbi:serine/threonine protein phosphatase [Alphaproteobacteria bacterium KMM 3653]|uniref:Serine/threonine protein phosphatase n=1 Tax=Harenicola maris TaxID=2841044 RepID=A0AAP2CPQ2_9RHOB|nr:serine/threonine protein phosphatase [Harenicola maris]
MRCYAIGDIHGQLAQLENALALIEADGYDGEPIVFLGDYTDRGHESRQVIDLLIKGQAEGRNWITLKGNHDRMFEWFLEDTPRYDPDLKIELYWLHPRLGGDTTLASYGVDAGPLVKLGDAHAAARAAVPQEHVDFLKNLPLTHTIGDLFFVHAGIRPGVPLDSQAEDDLLWIRDGWLDNTDDHGKLVVHGHTLLLFPQHYGNRVNLDGGAGKGHPLVPAVFEGRDCWTLSKDGRKELVPE